MTLPDGRAEDGSIIPIPQPSDPRLGRIPHFDARSRNYPVRALIPPTYAPRSYTWSCGIVLNQGNIGSCVGNSIAHEIAARPVVVKGVEENFALQIYHRAQQLDPWPGENYEGTSVLAGMQAGKEFGYYAEYRWAFGIEDLILALGYKGPAVLGIRWDNNMFSPDASGIIRPGGGVAGGHAILANGVSLRKQLIRLHNSWGAWWGINGEAFISFEDLRALLADGGEACIPVARTTP